MEKDINNIINSKNSQERRARTRSVLIISVIFLAGLFWLFWTNHQVNKMNDKMMELNMMIQSKEQKIDQLEESLDIINNYLHEADNFKTYKIDISPGDRKYYLYADEIANPVREVFQKMIELQSDGIKFNIYGKSIADGFSSPALISYLLTTIGVIDSVYSNSAQLATRFNEATGAYQTGDLIIYESGYCMMYFTNKHVHNDYNSFVLGMTPSGIMALSPDFAKEIRRIRPNYE